MRGCTHRTPKALGENKVRRRRRQTKGQLLLQEEAGRDGGSGRDGDAVSERHYRIV